MAKQLELTRNESTAPILAAVDCCVRPDLQIHIDAEGRVTRAIPGTGAGVALIHVAPHLVGFAIGQVLELAAQYGLVAEVICYGGGGQS